MLSISRWFPSVCFQPGSSLSYRLVTMHPSAIGCLYKTSTLMGSPNKLSMFPTPPQPAVSHVCLLHDQIHVALANLTQLGWTAPCTWPMWGMVKLLSTHACVSGSVGPHHGATLERQGAEAAGQNSLLHPQADGSEMHPRLWKVSPSFFPCCLCQAFSSGELKLRPKEMAA